MGALKRLTVTIPAEVRAAADREAKRLGRSRSWVVSEALRRWLLVGRTGSAELRGSETVTAGGGAGGGGAARRRPPAGAGGLAAWARPRPPGGCARAGRGGGAGGASARARGATCP